MNTSLHLPRSILHAPPRVYKGESITLLRDPISLANRNPLSFRNLTFPRFSSLPCALSRDGSRRFMAARRAKHACAQTKAPRRREARRKRRVARGERPELQKSSGDPCLLAPMWPTNRFPRTIGQNGIPSPCRPTSCILFYLDVSAFVFPYITRSLPRRRRDASPLLPYLLPSTLLLLLLLLLRHATTSANRNYKY